MANAYGVAAHWSGEFEETALQKWAEDLRAQLQSPFVSLGLVFMTPRFFQHATQVLELMRVHAQIPLLAGCSSTSLIANDQEIEANAGLAVGLYHLPGAQLKALTFTQEQVEEANGPGYWHLENDVTPDQSNGWLVFADPFHLDAETWLRDWNEAYSPLPIVGGLASGDPSEQSTQLYFNGDVLEEGGVAVSIGGEVELASIVSQGCTPIGETWTITRSEKNMIHEIANRPAYEVLAETYNHLTPQEQLKSRGNLFVGLVANEYLHEFHRGDFLIRQLLGADPNSGIVAVGALPRPGQTLQFQRRDAATGTEDMESLLNQRKEQLAGKTIYGGCLCCCNGRGERLFGKSSHDARFVQNKLGPLAVAGFFCNGEIGPVGDKNFLHGYTASLALFVKRS